jgi:hypothetical protein
LEVTKLTAPDTWAPFAGELIVTEPAGAGVEVEVEGGVELRVGVGVEVAVAVRVEVRVGVGRCFAASAVPRLATTVNSAIAAMRR